MERYNDVNQAIRKMIDDAKTHILDCKGNGDPDSITYDGIVSNDHRLHPLKLVYLLKEPNDGRNRSQVSGSIDMDNFDFPDTMREEAKAQNGEKPKEWPNLCYWTKAYIDARDDKDSLPFNDSEVQTCGGLLYNVALVNIKKVPGGQKTDEDSFIRTVVNTECQELLRTEIECICSRMESHKIVVCGGTYESARIIFGIPSNSESEHHLDCGARYFEWNKIYFLDFIHPSQRGAAARHSMTYAYAKEVFRSLVKELGKVSNE